MERRDVLKGVIVAGVAGVGVAAPEKAAAEFRIAQWPMGTVVQHRGGLYFLREGAAFPTGYAFHVPRRMVFHHGGNGERWSGKYFGNGDFVRAPQEFESADEALRWLAVEEDYRCPHDSSREAWMREHPYHPANWMPYADTNRCASCFAEKRDWHL